MEYYEKKKCDRYDSTDTPLLISMNSGDNALVSTTNENKTYLEKEVYLGC